MQDESIVLQRGPCERFSVLLAGEHVHVEIAAGSYAPPFAERK